MTKWFKAHRRQIFAVLAVLSFIGVLSCGCIGVFAYTNQYPNSLTGVGDSSPTTQVPFFPTVGDEDFVQDNYYFNDLGDTYPRYKPLFNYSLGIIAEDQDEELKLFEYDIGSNRTLSLGDNDVDKFSNYTIGGTPIGTIRVQSEFDEFGTITDKMSIFGLGNDYLDFVLFFDDFYFTPTWLEDAPSSGVDDYICSITYDEYAYKHGDHEFYVTGLLSYVGNVTTKELYEIPFAYYAVPNANGEIDIMYSDIVYNAIYGEYGEYYASLAMESNVPIHIRGLTVYDDTFFNYEGSAIDVTVEYRYQTVGEYYMYSIDKSSLYEGMLKFYSEIINELPTMDWIIDAISGFMNTPLFGAISFGAIFTMIFSYSIVKVVLEVFKG